MAGSHTGSEYECDVPGSSTRKKLRLKTVRITFFKTYSRQDLEASETQSTSSESQRFTKVAKTSSERSREFRARKALLKQQSEQEQQRDSIDEISEEDSLSPMQAMEKRTKSAEATRKWREKNRGVNGLLKKQAKTASQRMREYRERKKLARKILLKQQSEQQNPDSIDNASIEKKEKNMNTESDIQPGKDKDVTSNMDILLRHTGKIDLGQSSIGDICATHNITNSNAVKLDNGNKSGSCTWSSFEPSEGRFSITKTEGSFNNRTTKDQAQKSLHESVVIKNEPFPDSSPFCEATGSSFVDKEIFRDHKDFKSNHETQYFNQSVQNETIFDVNVERDEYTIYGQYIADRFRKCKRNDTEVNAARNHIERILFDLSTGAYSYICSVDKNQIVAPVVQAIIVKEEVDL